MRFLVLLVGFLATAALVVAFGWPVLLASFLLALVAFLLSTADAEAEESSHFKDRGQLRSQ